MALAVPRPSRDGLRRFAHGRRLVSVKLDAIVFDCADAAPLARFWAAALGWQVAPYEEDELARLSAEGVDDPEDDPSVMVEPPEGSGLPVLFFTEVPEAEGGRRTACMWT